MGPEPVIVMAVHVCPQWARVLWGMSIQCGGSVDRPCTILSRRGGCGSKVWAPKLVPIVKLMRRPQVPRVSRQDPRLGWSGWGCNRTHTQDSDSIVKLECVATEVNESTQR